METKKPRRWPGLLLFTLSIRADRGDQIGSFYLLWFVGVGLIWGLTRKCTRGFCGGCRCGAVPPTMDKCSGGGAAVTAAMEIEPDCFWIGDHPLQNLKEA